MKARKPPSAIVRGLYLSIVAAFGFFLVSSAPHRVHHLFEQSVTANQITEQAEGAEHHDGDHHKRQPSQPTDCFVLSVAQNAHASVVQPFNFVTDECAITQKRDQPISIAFSFNLAPFSQRAPPLA